jgi:hypothetical protein
MQIPLFLPVLNEFHAVSVNGLVRALSAFSFYFSSCLAIFKAAEVLHVAAC